MPDVEVRLSIRIDDDVRVDLRYADYVATYDSLPSVVRRLVLRAADSGVRAYPGTMSPYSDDPFRAEGDLKPGAVKYVPPDNDGYSDDDIVDHP